MNGPARAVRAVALSLFSVFSAACSNDITAPAAPTTVAGPATETLSGTMARNGTAIRTFTASKSGTVSVTLASAGPPSTIVLGLGIGIRGATGADCDFSQTVNTSAGSAPQLNVAVDAGTYCAGVYDIGNIGPNGINVSITVNHP